MESEIPLEAVFYPGPVPGSLASLTFLGIVFDRIIFPHVRLPVDGYDPIELALETDRIAALPSTGGIDDRYLVAALSYVPYVKVLSGFCEFVTVPKQMFGSVDPAANELVKSLDEAIHGPPRPGFIPTYSTGFHKGLPGNKVSIDYPGPLHYPSNALVYAAKHGLPLINDNPHLPVPAFDGSDAKNNTKLLSTILSVQCASVVLPKIRPLRPEEIMELRSDMEPFIRPFRLAIRRLSIVLNNAITNESTAEEIVRAARFVVETEVQPTVLEMKESLERPDRGWYERAYDAAKKVPEIAASFATLSASDAIAKTLMAIGDILVDTKKRNAQSQSARTGYYYLLRVGEALRD